jgi:glycosyltransferase involved in cell wall biosynthesis
MRVLHILNELRPSGAETMLRAASGYWRSLGIESDILITGARAGEYAEALSRAGYTLHCAPFRRSPAFLFAVWRFLRGQRYDGVHIHCERANFWYATAAYLAGCRRIVRSAHGLFEFHGMLRLRRYLQRFVLRAILRVRTVAVSPAVRRAEWERYRNPALHISNWFDCGRFRVPSAEARALARMTLRIPEGSFAIVTVGNCSRVKNHAAVIEALAAPMPREIVYLHAGCEEDAQADRRLARRLGVEDSIRFLGPVDDVAAVLHAADLFLMPSLHEGLGIAAVEALAVGLPAVLADVEGLRELRAIAPECEWVRPEASAFASAVRRFLERTSEDRRALGERLSARVHERYAVANGAGQYAALYAGGPAQ